ncbi:MAG: efflux RND transporter permease subunit, partial [Rhodocyclaceae bacterium]|nr:efflux RND transporter permease subunit [Rhodocyclaceae bacterium]
LNKIVDLSLRYKLLVLVGFGLVVFLGVRAFLAVPVDAFPDVTPNQVNVYTESPGLAAGDKVVTAGTYALKARIMKSQLGEGHAH